MTFLHSNRKKKVRKLLKKIPLACTIQPFAVAENIAMEKKKNIFYCFYYIKNKLVCILLGECMYALKRLQVKAFDQELIVL